MAIQKLGALCLVTAVSLFGKNTIEAEKIILKGKNGARIELSCEEDAVIRMVNGSGNVATEILVSAEGESTISMNDPMGRNRLQMHGGASPSVYMRNDKGEIVGAFLMLQDGGAAIGLADNEGDVAALLRGGGSPSMGLFQKASEPSVALGINKNVPHMLITSKESHDSMIVHGGETTSLLFVDDRGDVSVFLSKHGLYQGKKQEGEEQKKKSSDTKVFTWEDFATPIEEFKLSPR